MGLFVKKEHALPLVPLYSVGQNQTILVVGLGNMGAEYEGTRHNLGFYCVDQFAKLNDFGTWQLKKDLQCHLTSHNLGQSRVILVKPTTYMNLSGESVHAVQHFYKIAASQTVIVHDELDIPFGQIRIRQGGGSAGNNGLKSILQHGGEQTWRLRLGIHTNLADQADSADFVLGKFSRAEQAELPKLAREVNAILTEYIFGGHLRAETRTVCST